MRSARAAGAKPVWVRSTSSICSPQVMTGLSAVIGSWKIIAMRIQRSARRRGSPRAPEILALEQDAAGDRGQLSLRQQAHDAVRRDRLARAPTRRPDTRSRAGGRRGSRPRPHNAGRHLWAARRRGRGCRARARRRWRSAPAQSRSPPPSLPIEGEGADSRDGADTSSALGGPEGTCKRRQSLRGQGEVADEAPILPPPCGGGSGRGIARAPKPVLQPCGQAGVERIAQAVAEHVHREHGEREEDAREQNVVGNTETARGPRP